jgi:uncharacterized membrane protein YqaE (UPF0057 family)
MKMYILAVFVPPVAVFLSTERLRSRIVSAALTLLWGVGLIMVGQSTADSGAMLGVLLVLPSIIHAVLTVRDSKGHDA